MLRRQFVHTSIRGQCGKSAAQARFLASDAPVLADLDRRLEEYRWQGGAYALAVEGATGETVSRVVFLFLTPVGALERELTDLDAARRR